MEIDANTVIGIITLSGAGIAVGGAWVISVEKRINGLRSLKTTLEKIDRRTERLSIAIRGRDVAHDDVDDVAGV